MKKESKEKFSKLNKGKSKTGIRDKMKIKNLREKVKMVERKEN